MYNVFFECPTPWYTATVDRRLREGNVTLTTCQLTQKSEEKPLLSFKMFTYLMDYFGKCSMTYVMPKFYNYHNIYYKCMAIHRVRKFIMFGLIPNEYVITVIVKYE